VILVDLNVLLDVLQEREPHYRASAAVLDRVITGDLKAVIAAHAVTTIHYLVARLRDRHSADEVVDMLLRHFEIVAIGREQMLRARSLAWSDFEDAVVTASAESARCSAVITRNTKDFRKSPVSAMTPEEFLASRSMRRPGKRHRD